jgi:hypothetical protein
VGIARRHDDGQDGAMIMLHFAVASFAVRAV